MEGYERKITEIEEKGMKGDLIHREPEIIDEGENWKIILSWGEDGAKAGMSYSKGYFKDIEDVKNNMERIIMDFRGPSKWG